MTEKQLQDAVLDAAYTFKWLAYHTYDSRRSSPGFPDLVLARNGEVLFVELKSKVGRLRPEQKVWMEQLTAYSEPGCDRGHEVLVWRPEQWQDGTIIERLR